MPSINMIYPEVHQQGVLRIENAEFFGITLKEIVIKGDVGLQVSSDGRIWLCIDGVAFIRFKPNPIEVKSNIDKGK